MNPDVTTYKIRFEQYGEGLDLEGGKFRGICYIEEKAGSFTLVSVHNSDKEIKGMKIDIIRPGRYILDLMVQVYRKYHSSCTGVHYHRTYDIRIVSGVHDYHEENVPDCVKTVAEKIATSLTRLIIHADTAVACMGPTVQLSGLE